MPAATHGEHGHTLPERLSARLTFDINGIWGGYLGEGAKTIIPAMAGAKFSTRLVPDQDHREIERLAKEYLEAIAPPTVRVEVRIIHGGAPAITPLDHSGIDPSHESAGGRLRQAAAVPALGRIDPGGGGARRGPRSEDAHGRFRESDRELPCPNEWMSLRNIRNGMVSLVHLWAELGAMPASDLRVE